MTNQSTNQINQSLINQFQAVTHTTVKTQALKNQSIKSSINQLNF